MICNKCGTDYNGNFCPTCGTPAQPQMQQNQSQQVPPPVMPQQSYQNPYTQPMQPPKKKKRGCLTAILIVIGVFILLGIIGSLLTDDEPKVANKPEVNSPNEKADVTEDEKADTTEDKKADITDEDKVVENETEEIVEATPYPDKTTFSVGEKVELNDILVTLVDVTESNGSDFNKPADGNVFALCEFEIENNSNGDIAVSSIISFEAYVDSYSTNMSLSALIEKGDKNQLDGSVAAGKKMRGIVGYEIPFDWNELEINFTPSFWSSKSITFIATK